MSSNKNRFDAIHGLRGVAAMMVVVYHLVLNLENQLENVLPNWLMGLASIGFVGVPIFFVISGFVISYGISGDKVDGNYVSRFIVRRSVRLDPTYWASILIAIVLLYLQKHLLGEQLSIPDAQNTLIHMFYMQDLLNVSPSISVVYWTLCLEVQFYLFFITAVWISQKVKCRYSDKLLLGVLIAVGIYSVLINFNFVPNPLRGLFVAHWHYFLLGVLVNNIFQKRKCSEIILMCWTFFLLAVQIVTKWEVFLLAAMATSVFIWLAQVFGLMGRLLSGTIWTYLGTISYTLYLLHADIGWKTASLGKKILGDDMAPLSAVFILVVAIAVSILSSHILHLLVERPSFKIAHSLKQNSFKSSLRMAFKEK